MLHAGDSLPGLVAQQNFHLLPVKLCKVLLPFEAPPGPFLQPSRGKKIIAAHLVCTRNPSHAIKTSTELFGIKTDGFTRLWDDYSARIKNDSKGPDPRVTRPIVECQDCVEFIWPDGIYGEQKPGATMWPPGF